MPVTVGSCYDRLIFDETILLFFDRGATVRDIQARTRMLDDNLYDFGLHPTVRIEIGFDHTPDAELVVDFDSRESCRVLTTRRDVEAFVDCFSAFFRRLDSRSKFFDGLDDRPS